MFEVVFLWVLALVWIVFATVQDLKSREIANWLNFSLIIFALGFRLFYSLFSGTDFTFFYQGVIGLGIFFVIGNFLYYGRMFAGGDAKLMIALGAVLPIYGTVLANVSVFMTFLLLFFFSGALYSLLVSGYFALKNLKPFRKEFVSLFRKKRKILYPAMFLGLVVMAFGFVESLFFIFGFVFFLLPYFYVFAKAVDEACMIKKVKVKDLTEGDWLYKNIKVGNKKIKATWSGLSKKDIALIKKKLSKVDIRQGIPFTPAFLISMVVLFLLYVLKIKLWNPFF